MPSWWLLPRYCFLMTRRMTSHTWCNWLWINLTILTSSLSILARKESFLVKTFGKNNITCQAYMLIALGTTVSSLAQFSNPWKNEFVSNMSHTVYFIWLLAWIGYQKHPAYFLVILEFHQGQHTNYWISLYWEAHPSSSLIQLYTKFVDHLESWFIIPKWTSELS